MSYILVGFVQL